MNKITYLVLPVIAVTAGCAIDGSVSKVITDPNNIPIVLDTVGAVSTAVGGSVGGLILIGTNVASAAYAAWQRNKKKKSETKYDTLQRVTTAVVEVINEVEDMTLSDNSTIGDTVKAKVKGHLKSSNTYESGKKIITAIKEGITDGKN